MKQKLLSFLLATAMTISLLPAFALAATTETIEKNIVLGTAALSEYDSTNDKYEYIYYGIYDNEPIKWNILSKNGNDGTYFDSTPYNPTTPPSNPEDGKEYTDSNGIKFIYLAESDKYYNQTTSAPMFLLSKHTLKQLAYDSDGIKNSGQTYVSDWRYSDAWFWCNDTTNDTFFIRSSFTNSEKTHILKTSKSNSLTTGYSDELKGDMFFFLSESESENDYMKNDKKAYPLNDNETAVWWWLRSPLAGNCVDCVDSNGDIDYPTVESAEPAARPAFNLNQSSVLFTSAAVGGKNTDNVGTLKLNGTNSTGEYKLTVKDDTRNFTVASKAISAFADSSTEINYSGAEVANNEYISAIILDDAQNVLYYGQLKANNTASSGTITFKIPKNLLPGEYTLQLFNEQINDDKKTDYSSEFQTITLTVEDEKNITLGTFALSGYDTVNRKYDYIYYGTYETNPIKWRILTMNGNEGRYTDSNNMVVPSTNAMFLLSEYSLKKMAFESAWDFDDQDGQTKPSDWRYSDAWFWCNDTTDDTSFISSSFTDSEKRYLLKTSKDNALTTGFNDELDEDTFFFLSESEFAKDYINNESISHLVDAPETRFGWWLRSPNFEYNVFCVYETGVLFNGGLVKRTDFANRPAFNLNYSSVLFTSAAVGGKNTDNVGTLKLNGTNSTGEYKLTMKDDTHNSFKIKGPNEAIDISEYILYTLPGDTVTLTYENAETGNGEYVSAMIVNDKKEVLYYGQLEKARSGRVDINVKIPSDIDYGKYELLLFNEQINGDKKLDFSSDFQTVTLNIKKMLTANDFTFTLPSDLTYDGNAKEANVVSDNSGIGAIKVKYYDTGGNPLSGAPTDVGTYIVKIDVAEGDEYFAATDLSDNSWTFSITKANMTVSGADVAVTYGEKFTLTATVEKTTNLSRSITDSKVEFWLVDDDEEKSLGVVDVAYTNAVSGTATLEIDTTDKALNAGENSITAVYGGNVNLNGGKDDTITVMLNQKEVGLTWSGHETRIYDGEQSLVEAKATKVESGDKIGVLVSGGNKINANPSDMFYVATATALTGDVSAYYKLPNNAIQLYRIDPKPVVATINISDQTYTGSAITPQIAAFDGTTEIPAKEYAVSYSDNVNAGAAKVTLNDNEDGNYIVSGNATFKILPKSIKDAVLAIDKELTYDGSEQTQSVVLTLYGFKNVTFDISGNKQTNVKTDGNYTLTVIGTDNFSGEKTLDWNIKPYTPTEKAATTARVRKGGTLADAAVTAGTISGLNNVTLEGTFAWVDKTKTINADTSEQMTFTPTDTNYAQITINVAISTCSTVTFDCGDENTFTKTVDLNTSVAEPTSAPVRDGYYFGGWYIGDTPYNFANTVSKDTTITAKWLERGKFGISITPNKIYIVSGDTNAKAYSAAYMGKKLMDVMMKNIINYEVITLNNMDLNTTNADSVSLFVWNENLSPLCNKINLPMQ